MTDFRRCYDEIPDHLAHAITWAKANPDLAVFTYPKETTMTTKQYTAEDFANAEFARHPDGRVAARVDSGNLGWWAGGNGRAEPSWMDDYDMAEEGFIPVREAQPITLDALQAAWEGAEQAEECVPGDVVIRSGEDGRYVIIPVEHGTRLIGKARILHRAPKPERPEGAAQLEALLDEWGDLARSGEPTPLADWLAERIARVTEEGEK